MAVMARQACYGRGDKLFPTSVMAEGDEALLVHEISLRHSISKGGLGFTVGGRHGYAVTASTEPLVLKGWRLVRVNGTRVAPGSAESLLAKAMRQSRGRPILLAFVDPFRSKRRGKTAGPRLGGSALGQLRTGKKEASQTTKRETAAVCKGETGDTSRRPVRCKVMPECHLGAQKGDLPRVGAGAEEDCKEMGARHGEEDEAAAAAAAPVRRAPCIDAAEGRQDIQEPPSGWEQEHGRQQDADAGGSALAASTTSRGEARTKTPPDIPAAGSPSTEPAKTVGALRTLPGKPKVANPQRSLLTALCDLGPLVQKTTPKTGPCDKCDGCHHSDDCPHFPNAREAHADAWSAYQCPPREGASPGGATQRPISGQVVGQPGDGSCLYHSLCHGLKLISEHEGEVPVVTADALRRDIADFVASCPGCKVAGTPLRDWVLWDSGLDVSAYSKRMRAGRHWGGAIEMAVCAVMKSVDIDVYERAGSGLFKAISSFRTGSERAAGRVCSVVYGGRVHYDALSLPQ